MLFTGLVCGITSALIAFSGLKVATRLKDAAGDRISNDYFLIGNLTSITLVLIEYAVWQGWPATWPWSGFWP